MYLWETGVAAPPVPMSEDTSTEMEERAAALTTNKRMGVAGGAHLLGTHALVCVDVCVCVCVCVVDAS